MKLVDKNQFFKNLTTDLKPIRKLWKPHQRLLAWSALSVVVVVASMLLVQGFRPGFLGQLLSLRFAVETFFAFMSFFALGLVVLLKSIPGIKVSRLVILLAALPFLMFVGLIVYGYFVSPSLSPTMAGKRPDCFIEILTLSWLPILMMSYLLRKGLSQRSVLLNFSVGLCGAILPMALMQVACMYDPYHILSHHIYGATLVALAATCVVGVIVHFKKSC